MRLTTKLDDHLGSTDVLISAVWNASNKAFAHQSTEYQAFDPWGERANEATAIPYRQHDADPFRRSAQDYDRGYTGHEQLDDSGLIHMNGRIYDPELGRMLSPDPYVQVPEYSQNFNRYSYVLNNPLNKTDPTGYSWVSKAFHKIGSWLKENWRTIAMIALGAVAFWGAGIFVAKIGLEGIVATMAQGAIAGATMGGVSAAISGSSVLQGMAMGALNGAITGGLGNMGNGLLKAIGTAAISGFSNVAMGGKFQDGFIDSLKFQAAIGFAKGLSSFMKSHMSGKHYDNYANVSRGEEAMPLNDAGYKMQDNYNMGARTPAQLMKGV